MNKATTDFSQEDFRSDCVTFYYQNTTSNSKFVEGTITLKMSLLFNYKNHLKILLNLQPEGKKQPPKVPKDHVENTEERTAGEGSNTEANEVFYSRYSDSLKF